ISLFLSRASPTACTTCSGPLFGRAHPPESPHSLISNAQKDFAQKMGSYDSVYVVD
ncbi:hypothetical protein M404DRAFT_993394, partial [Pisolithus tinctorius Marx 270]